MKFEHRVEIDAPQTTVRDFLDDVPRSARCLPGLEEIHQTGEDTYDGRVAVRLGPMGFHIGGTARLERDTDKWKLIGEGRDRRVGAGVVASVEARLNDLPSSRTEVLISADVQFSGRLGELGQPLIKRKADSMVKEFAGNLQKAIASEGRPPPPLREGGES
jgi:carbon monoxide dehydrogenase subunit G